MKQSRVLRHVVAVAWAASVTLTMQYWVGRETIYRPALTARIEAAHEAILRNRPPDGTTWTRHGMNTTNIRVGTIFLAEGITRVTGWRLTTTYRVLDTVALFASLLLLLAFLGRVVPPPYPVIGAMAYGIALPLTYQLFAFHPWDRISVVGWIVLLMLLERRRFVLFAAVLPLMMVIKFDVLVLPGLFFLFTVPLRNDRRGVIRSALLTTALFAMTFGIYWALQAWRPGGFEPVALGPLAIDNLETIRYMRLSYPPLLGFGVPLVLAAVGFRRSERFAQACAVFAVLLLIVFAVKSRFEEFRTEVPVFLLLLPAALMGLRSLLEPDDRRHAGANPMKQPAAEGL